ncbi:MAG: MFS transporter [Chloroflexota bacterium]
MTIGVSELTGRVRGVSYGWWVAIMGGLGMALTVGPFEHGVSTLFAGIEDDTGWSRATVSAAASVGHLSVGMMMPINGLLVDRLGSGRMALTGLLITGLGAILLSRVADPIWYYAAFLVTSAGIGLGAFTPAMAAVNAWLSERRATGIAIIEGGASAGVLLAPVLAWSITTHGWRPSVAAIGVVLVLFAPLAYKVMSRPAPRQEPEEQGSAREASNRPNRRVADYTLAEAMRTRAFWAMIGSHTLINLALATVGAHLVLHLTDEGMSLGAASVVLTIVGALNFAGHLAGGVVGDRVNKQYAVVALFGIQSAAIAFLAFVDSFFLAMVFAVLWSIGWGMRPPIFHALRGDYYGRRHFGAILGFSELPLALGMTAAPVIVGWAQDVQGTYQWSFLALSVLGFVGTALMLLATPPRRQPRPR